MRRSLLLFVCGSSFAATTLSLQEAESQALRNHPQLQAARAQRDVASVVPGEVRARLRPQLSANTTGAASQDDNTRIQAGALNNPVIYNRMAVGLTATQTVTDFGRTKYLAESAELRAQAAGQAVEVARADVLLRVRRAYYRALQTQAILKVARATVTARTAVADQAATLAANKLKSDLDVTFARVNLQEAKLLENTALNDAKSSMVELANAIGLDAVTEYELMEDPLPLTLAPDWEAVVREAMQNRPELRQAKFEQRAAASFVKAERSLMFPTVDAIATSGVAPAHASRLEGHWVAAGVNLSFPILNGGLYKARRVEAEARERAANAIAQDASNRIARDVRLAFLNAVNAFERMQLTAALLDQAQQSLKLAQARYDLGLSSIVELSQAQLNLTNAEITQTSARFEYQAARASLEYQKGTM